MELVYCRMTNDPLHPRLSCWLETIPAPLRDRFIESDLIDSRSSGAGDVLTAHLEDFKQSLLAKGNTEDYVKTKIARAKRIIERCGFRFWRDVSASQVEQYLSEMRNGEENISAQTFNFYLQAIKQFAKWMVNNGRATASPLQHLQGLNVRVDRRHDRRSLDVEEVRRLLETTSAAPTRFSMTGQERALLYRLAIETALRHTTGSLLAAAGVYPKVIQSIMRHSDINLTMSRYTHIFRGQESEAVSRLPDLGTASEERRNAATGTDGKK